METPDQGSTQTHAGQAFPDASPRRRLRWRVLDWVIGALGMLGLILLALLILWLSITRPEGSSADTPSGSASPSSTPSSITGATPPPDLATNEVWLGDISLSADSVIAAGTPLSDVVGTGSDVTSGPDGLVARHLDLTATVPFDVVAAELGPDATLSAAERGEVRVDTRVEALGRILPVGATGSVDVVGGQLVIVPTSIDIGGPPFISELLGGALRELITIEHRIEGLPDGVVLRSVTVVGDGFRANLTGDDVRLVQ